MKIQGGYGPPALLCQRPWVRGDNLVCMVIDLAYHNLILLV